MCKNCVHTRMAKRKSNKKTNELYRTVSANSPWFVNFHSKTTSKWRSDPLRARHMTYPSLPVDDFGYRPQIIFRVVGSNISLQKASRLTHPSMKYFEKNFQAPLGQVRHHIVSDPLEYWHLTPVIWSREVILLTYGIMTYSKPNSSPSFELCTKKMAYRYIWGTSHSMNHLCTLSGIDQRAGSSHHSKIPPSHCD